MAIRISSVLGSRLHRAAGRGGVAGAIVCLCAMGAAVSLAPPAAGLPAAALMPVLGAIACIDKRSFIIPDPLNGVALVLGFVSAAAGEGGAESSLVAAVLRGAIAALVFLTLRAAYSRWRGREGLGLGDVKLAGVAGVWLAPQFLALAVEVAAFAGLAAFGLMACRARRPLRGGARLPFGLFFAPAIGLAVLAQLVCLAGALALPEGLGGTP